MTTQDSLPGVANLSGWDSILPTEFLWEVSAFRLPLPLSFAWRELILILILILIPVAVGPTNPVKVNQSKTNLFDCFLSSFVSQPAWKVLEASALFIREVIDRFCDFFRVFAAISP